MANIQFGGLRLQVSTLTLSLPAWLKLRVAPAAFYSTRCYAQTRQFMRPIARWHLVTLRFFGQLIHFLRFIHSKLNAACLIALRGAPSGRCSRK